MNPILWFGSASPKLPCDSIKIQPDNKSAASYNKLLDRENKLRVTA